MSHWDPSLGQKFARLSLFNSTVQSQFCPVCPWDGYGFVPAKKDPERAIRKLVYVFSVYSPLRPTNKRNFRTAHFSPNFKEACGITLRTLGIAVTLVNNYQKLIRFRPRGSAGTRSTTTRDSISGICGGVWSSTWSWGKLLQRRNLPFSGMFSDVKFSNANRPKCGSK